MRVIGTISHPVLKITVFRMDSRLSVKFENAGYEQTFKLGDHERLNSLEAVEAWVDEALLRDVLAGLGAMHRSRLAADARALPAVSESEFEEIL
ncbi:MAG: hypothetical protein IPM98_11515 [Lewinellaceae bacterium]|nr:hypothetical protein [Lewinellaceae bacterium]